MRVVWFVAWAVVACSQGEGEVNDDLDLGDLLDTGITPIMAVDDRFEAQAYFPVEFNVGENDEGERLRIVDLTEPSAGSRVTQEGRRKIVFEANPDFEGLETFEYTVRDQAGNEDSATVEVEVFPGPSVTITSPADSTELVDGTVTVEFEVEGCIMASPSANARGCHLHVKIDGSAYSEGQGIYSSASRTLEVLPEGEFELALRLVTNDGSDAELRTPEGDYVDDRITLTAPTP